MIVLPFKYFNPDYSIKNTQSFLMNDITKNEAKLVEERLGEYIYRFPYEIKPSYRDMFDDTKEAIDKFGGKKK